MARYFRWLWQHAREQWWVLDPVVSVHPEGVIFEVFSRDESSYGRVTVPCDQLQVFGAMACGTTNVDFSWRLARELERVRSYRPAWLQIGAAGVTLATHAGEALEKKIDLPPSWVRGFLQVQSAATAEATELVLSADTVAEVLSVFRRRRETRGPRSLRFLLEPGTCPVVIVEPWSTAIPERDRRFTGAYRGEIRVWGRRRLLVLSGLLPHAEAVTVRLLGTGMPSYWTVLQEGHRFDLGLSGWTANDWARSARFDLLASPAAAAPAEAEAAAAALAAASSGSSADAPESLRVGASGTLTPEALAEAAGMPRAIATAALQRLCAQGQAMFDPTTGGYRWRPLFPVAALPVEIEDPRLATARRLVAASAVRWVAPPPAGYRTGRAVDVAEREADGRRSPASPLPPATFHRAQVRGEKRFEVTLEVDADGRVPYAQCTCSWHRREKLRKGPCPHILAAAALLPPPAAPAPVAEGEPAALSGEAARRLFDGMTFVFTGALTRFTREEAEALVARAGGRAAGSVSRATTYLVTGERAGSKLARARELGVPVLTEDQFLAMLAGEGAPV
jgi:hypothetical protein